MAVFRPLFPPWELVPYDELRSRHRVDAFVTTSGQALHDSFTGTVPIQSLPYGKLTSSLTNNWHMRRLIAFRTIYPDTSLTPLVLDRILREGYDIVDVLENYSYSALQAVLAGEFSDAKVVVMSWENLVYPPWRFPLRYFVNRLADVFRVPSLSAKRKLLQEGVAADRIWHLPACVDTDRFRPHSDEQMKSALGLSGKEVVLFIGRLVPQKGVVQLLEAFAGVAKERPSATLVFAGDGPLAGELKARSLAEGLGERVVFLGPTHYDTIERVHSISDVTVLPSIPTRNWEEQFGFALVEAMASGKPVIGTVSGAMPEIVRPGVDGLLVSPGSPEGLYGAISRVLSDENLRERMGAAARAKAEANYSCSSIALDMEEMYESLIKRPSSRPS